MELNKFAVLKPQKTQKDVKNMVLSLFLYE